MFGVLGEKCSQENLKQVKNWKTAENLGKILEYVWIDFFDHKCRHRNLYDQTNSSTCIFERL